MRDSSSEKAPGSGVAMHLLPIVSWPKQMSVGRRHLVAVDLTLVTWDRKPAPWPLPAEEECVYTCGLDGGADFDLWAVDDAAVVLHRFGGSYGPAEFVVTPKDKPGERLIWLTIINQRGVPIGEHPLRVEVRAAGDEALSPERGKAGISRDDPYEQARDGEPENLSREKHVPIGLNGIVGDLAAADEGAADVLRSELPEIREVPAGAESAFVGPTVSDLVIPDLLDNDEDYRESEDLVGVTRHDIERVWETAPRGELDVRRRRDPARLAVRGLQEFYNVAGLRRSPSAQLLGEIVPLFSPGSARGSRVTFTARCSPSDERGTVFAVVATPGDGSGRSAEPRSVQSAKIPPGIYQVTAELFPPEHGLVRFHGLPAEPREDPRPWQEIMATVPGRLPPNGGPAHLIIAVETSALDEAIVRKRLGKARDLIMHVSTEATDFVCYSVITYGPHRIHFGNRDYPEQDTATLAWAATADDALNALALASRRGPEPFGYEWAAQLECMLTDLESDLTGGEGRPVIVTVGTRPPHPPRLDPDTEIFPCRRRIDWSAPMSLLTRHAGIKFGAIRDVDLGDRLWRSLGADAMSAGDFYAQGFAQALGLTSATVRPSAPPIALPLFAG